MALSYSDVYRVATYGPRVEEIGKEIQNQRNMAEGVVFFAKQKIQEQLEILQQKENAIFSLLGVKDINELNKRIEEFQAATFSFNGEALYSKFIGILESKNDKEYLAFENAVNEVINKNIFQDVNNYIETKGVEKARDAVLSFLNFDQGSHKFTSHKGMTSFEFFPNSFTKEQRIKWKSILKQKAKEEGYPAAKNWDLIVNSSDDSMQINFTWFKATGEKTKNDAKLLSDSEINEINNQIKTEIKSCVHGNDSALIGDIIDEILKTKEGKYSFFVGKNVNAIIGILGEIQGMYYIRKLLGNNSLASVAWRGGTLEGLNNTNPHQDLQIKAALNGVLETFGIQIKNTTSTLEVKRDLGIKVGSLNKTISFTEGSIGNIISKMSQIAPIDDGIQGLLETYYGTLKFNIPYHRDKRKKKGTQFLPGLRMSDKNAAEYQSLHEQLIGYQSQIDSLLSIFAAAFMYMDAFDYNSGGDFNSLYLIGGAAFIAASDVLQTVLSDLDSESQNPHFSMSMSAGNNSDIITALNSGKKGSPYTESVINDIKLTSAFKF